jgi:hypothetical protein
MTPPFILPSLFLALYAEIHYTLPLGLSLVRRNYPEILADLPWRVDRGRPLPILCLVKDAHRYPIALESMAVTIRWPHGGSWKKIFPLGIKSLDTRLWHHVVEIPRENLPQGPVWVDVLFAGRRRGRSFQFHNDNYRSLSHAPLRTLLSSESLPGKPNWYPGDPHVHSSYTEDQVEFGAPPDAVVKMAQALGLRWTAITDHSYDLDDLPGHHLGPDPWLGKWRDLQSEIQRLSERHPDFVPLLGEEISCGSARGRNVHLLALGAESFIPGSGDSAEHWPRTTPTLSIGQVLDRIRRDGGVAYAAHPEEPGSFLERLLLRRGTWSPKDYAHTGLSGLQIWNGCRNRGLWQGRDRWIRLLLRGYRLNLIGGNDAHGNFNRFRQLRLPFLSLRESQEQIFGRVHTYVHCPGDLSRAQILRALNDGQAVTTDGPFVTFTVLADRGRKATLGSSLPGRRFTVNISAHSSADFGPLERVDLYRGIIGGKEQRIRSYRRGRDFRQAHEATLSAHLNEEGQAAYLRIEAQAGLGDRARLAMTNPVWLNFTPRRGKDNGHPKSDGDDGAGRWQIHEIG